MLPKLIIVPGTIALASSAGGNFHSWVDSHIKNISITTAGLFLLKGLSDNIMGDSRIGQIAHTLALVGSGVLSQASFRRAKVLLWHLSSIFQSPSHPAKIRLSDTAGCQGIISGETIPEIVRENKLTKHHARALPNRRLQAAFGIQSCFTSSDPRLCGEFRNKVQTLMYVEEAKWIDFASAASTVARGELAVDTQETNLFQVVQMVTLKTVLTALFHKDPDDTHVDDWIRKLADEINQQWIRSKGEFDSDATPEWALENQTNLRTAANTVFPEWDEKDGENNPFNLILPGYETMWRVVLRCFVELTARQLPNADDWKQAVTKFLKTPNLTQLKNPQGKRGPPVAAINVAQEALRLYPPTRRIYRMFQDEGGAQLEAAADIEALQRNPSTWGQDCMAFRPERFVARPDEVNDPNFMPFGAAPFHCPAKRWHGVPMPFGLSMIALLVGALVEASEGKWVVVGDFPADGIPLNTDREAYKDAVLKRVKVEEE